MQIGIEDRDCFEIEDLLHQVGQLLTRLHVQIHLQCAPRELVEIVHLPAAQLGLARMAGHARRKPAYGERHQHKDHQGDRIGRIGGDGSIPRRAVNQLCATTAASETITACQNPHSKAVGTTISR